jgi:YD repeat-containing protein
LQTKQFQTYLNQGDTDQIFYKEDYTYSFELSAPENSELTNQRYFTLLQTDVFKNQDKLGSNKVEYSFFGTTVLPAKYYISKGEEPLDESIIIDAYNSNQQVIQYHKKNGMYTTISYVDKYPVIKLEGEYTVANGYIGMITSQIASIVNSSGWNGGKNQIIAKQQEARDYYSSHMVNTYTYDPNVGVTSVTGSNGKTEHYSYDSSERLNRIKDNDNNTIKQFIYNIKPQ